MGVSQVILIISVMTTMGALAALQSFMVERDMATSLIHINFNETLLSTAISEVIPESGLSVARSERRQPLRLAPWDLNASQLVGIDNALALARLRMDIESELRRIAHEAHIDLSIRPVGVIGLARELAAKEIVPPALLEPLQYISAVCNRGIHGEEVPNLLATSVVRVGGQLLERLRLLPDV